MGIKSFEDLKVWQNAMDLVPKVYALVKKLPRTETFGLSDQMRRSVVSVPANIAEGHARAHTKEFVHHLSIARGSLAELLTLLKIAERLEYLSKTDVSSLESMILEVRRPLWTLMQRLDERRQG